MSAKRILLLPGLGDVHWVLLKLQAWLAAKGPEWSMPEVSIWDVDKRPRTLEYFDLVPWLKKGDYLRLDLREDKHTFNRLYMEVNSGDVKYNFRGYDALIGLNGNMRNGAPFQAILGGAATNFEYGPVLKADNYGRHQLRRGPYFVLGFSGHGMFERAWCQRVTPERIRTLVAGLRSQYPTHRFLFTGLAWDDAFTRECMTERDELLVSRTTLPQFLSLLQHASGYLGWCGGNAILAQHLGVPTVVWWSRDYFPNHDRTGWQTLDHNRRPYQRVLEVEDYELANTLEVFHELFWRGT